MYAELQFTPLIKLPALWVKQVSIPYATPATETYVFTSDVRGSPSSSPVSTQAPPRIAFRLMATPPENAMISTSDSVYSDTARINSRI